MKVICKKRTAKGLDLTKVKRLFTDEPEYPLGVGKEYRVMGMEMDKDSNCLYYLVDDYGLLDWCPCMLFEITDNNLPKDWYLNIYDERYSTGIFALMGFYELCNEADYHDLLLERDEQAMRTYFKRKAEYEKEDELDEYFRLGAPKED